MIHQKGILKGRAACYISLSTTQMRVRRNLANNKHANGKDTIAAVRQLRSTHHLYIMPCYVHWALRSVEGYHHYRLFQYKGFINPRCLTFQPSGTHNSTNDISGSTTDKHREEAPGKRKKKWTYFRTRDLVTAWNKQWIYVIRWILHSFAATLQDPP